MKKRRKKPSRRVGHLQQKVILLLLGGLALGLCHSPKQYFRVARAIKTEWRAINRHALNKAIHALYQSKLVETKGNRDGTLTLVLSKEGKQLALTYDLENMKIKEPGHWDRKWRMVMFDVPENLKRVRDTLRMHFKDMGFYEFQKSVFVHPYPCAEEIEYIVEFYNARRHVRFVVATEIDNVIELKRHFQLS
ncbi:MAG: hypothetical protein A3H76_05830 [Candidatus Lloydbacteria bacterium RIFCSPLOWO2_02_FULL_54_12]|nr:MAG: hypothetical protein A3H76_05830 [Candidatus Lloydbacteria bacterium RIFCSPLOWO2_02_FULL_54_12]